MLNDHVQSSQPQPVRGGPGTWVFTPDPEFLLLQCTARIWHLLFWLKSFLDMEYWWIRQVFSFQIMERWGTMTTVVPYRDCMLFFSEHAHYKWQVKSYQKNSSHGKGKTSGNGRLLPRGGILVVQGDSWQWDDHSYESYHMLKAEVFPFRTTLSFPRQMNWGPGKEMISSWLSCSIMVELVLVSCPPGPNRSPP